MKRRDFLKKAGIGAVSLGFVGKLFGKPIDKKQDIYCVKVCWKKCSRSYSMFFDNLDAAMKHYNLEKKEGSTIRVYKMPLWNKEPLESGLSQWSISELVYPEKI